VASLARAACRPCVWQWRSSLHQRRGNPSPELQTGQATECSAGAGLCRSGAGLSRVSAPLPPRRLPSGGGGERGGGETQAWVCWLSPGAFPLEHHERLLLGCGPGSPPVLVALGGAALGCLSGRGGSPRQGHLPPFSWSTLHHGS